MVKTSQHDNKCWCNYGTRLTQHQSQLIRHNCISPLSGLLHGFSSTVAVKTHTHDITISKSCSKNHSSQQSALHFSYRMVAVAAAAVHSRIITKAVEYSALTIINIIIVIIIIIR